MPKCSNLACDREATQHSLVDIGGGMVADVWSCEEHYQEVMDSLPKGEKKKC
jgi:hypothetical protein